MNQLGYAHRAELLGLRCICSLADYWQVLLCALPWTSQKGTGKGFLRGCSQKENWRIEQKRQQTTCHLATPKDGHSNILPSFSQLVANFNIISFMSYWYLFCKLHVGIIHCIRMCTIIFVIFKMAIN